MWDFTLMAIRPLSVIRRRYVRERRIGTSGTAHHEQNAGSMRGCRGDGDRFRCFSTRVLCACYGLSIELAGCVNFASRSLCYGSDHITGDGRGLGCGCWRLQVSAELHG